MEFKVRTEGALFDAAQRDAVMKDEITAYLTKGSKQLERAIAEKMPVNTGATRGALFSQVRGVAQGRGEAIVSLPVEHAEVLESGSKPHWPPRAPIELWVAQRFREKGGSIRAAVRSVRKRGSRETFADRQSAAIRSIAFLVARKIAQRGTKAIRMFARSVTELQPDIDRQWAETVTRIAQRLSGR